MSSDKENKIITQKGHLLISEPFLGDPNFERTVVLLCEHGEEGSFGFVLNKYTEINLQDALEEIDEVEDAENIKLYIGGPVEQNTLHFIHCLGDKIEGSIKITEGIYWGGNYEQLKMLIKSHAIQPEEIRFFIGYSGWGKGQLDAEINEKAWIIADSDPDIVFNTSPEKLWREILKRMGGKFKEMSNYPTDPRLN